MLKNILLDSNPLVLNVPELPSNISMQFGGLREDSSTHLSNTTNDLPLYNHV